MPADATTRITTRVVRGVLWSYGSLGAVRLLVLASTATLARILSPRDFGLVALALIVTTFLDAVRDLGFNQALVVAADADLPQQADTAFCFTVALCTILALGAAALSPVAADFFRQPRLAGLLAVLALNLPLRSLGLTHYALAQRALDFRSRTLAEVAEVVARAAASIALALAGLGPWSLVLGYLSGTLVWSSVLWMVANWRPSFRPRRGDLPPLVGFGSAVTVMGLIGAGMGYVDNLFVGKVLGAAALGVYAIGFRLPEAFILDVVSAGRLVLFPAFTVVQRSRLSHAVIAATRYGLLLTLPVAVALITLAHPLVITAFGRRWSNAAPVIQVLAGGFVTASFGQAVGSAYLATRRIGVMLKLAMGHGALLVILLAIFVNHGIVAVAACQTAARLSFMLVGLYVATKVLKVSLRQLWSNAWPPLVAAGGMAIAMVEFEHAITAPWVALLSTCAIGAVVYLGLARLLMADAFSSIWRMASGRAAAASGTDLTLMAAREEPAGVAER